MNGEGRGTMPPGLVKLAGSREINKREGTGGIWKMVDGNWKALDAEILIEHPRP